MLQMVLCIYISQICQHNRQSETKRPSGSHLGRCRSFCFWTVLGNEVTASKIPDLVLKFKSSHRLKRTKVSLQIFPWYHQQKVEKHLFFKSTGQHFTAVCDMDALFHDLGQAQEESEKQSYGIQHENGMQKAIVIDFRHW